MATRKGLVSRTHASHDKSSASQLDEQDVQLADPGAEKVPPAQGEHVASPSPENVPVQPHMDTLLLRGSNE